VRGNRVFDKVESLIGHGKVGVLIDASRMESRARQPESPFPEGWYFVASRDEIRRRSLVEKTWLGREIVAWCDDRGAVCVADAFCPHMGSHLGPRAGGRVRDGCLVCPFHGFVYDASGQCVATPSAPAPTNARLDVLETQEINGMVFAWWSGIGQPSHWSLPVGTLDEDGWTSVRLHEFRLTTHPEYTTENSVDLAHLSYIHGYFDVRQVGPVTVDGAHLVSAFDFKRERPVMGLGKLRFSVSAVTHLHGLGYSFIDITEHTIGMRSRMWVLVTPIDGTYMEFVLASQIQEMERPKRLIVGLGFLPKRTRARVTNWMMLKQQAKDVRQDIDVWNNKCFAPRPILSSADGKIMLFRRFCRQFYPEAQEVRNAVEQPIRGVARL